jgi:anthranilate/para-aminobenzoate synthase component II
MLLMIDNYDSFTYNLVQYFGELGEDIRVFRNNKITIDQIESLKPSRIVISPGPCTPKEAGVSVTHIDYPGMIHGFVSMGGMVPAANEALAAGARAVKDALAKA